MSESSVVEMLNARMSIYALLARLLRCEVDPELLGEMRMVAHRGAALTQSVGYRAMASFLAATEEEPADEIVRRLSIDFGRLFLCGKRSICPCESAYTSPRHLLMQEAYRSVRRDYAIAGIGRKESSDQMDDCLALELEFMQLLCSRALLAIERGDAAAVAESVDCQRRFFAGHLANWVGAFAEDMHAKATTEFYRGVSMLLAETVEVDGELIDALECELAAVNAR